MAFLDRLHSDVPKVTRVNGMEETMVYARPEEVSDDWRGAARILLVGELAATVECGPEPAPEAWRREHQKLVQTLRGLVTADEVTTGDSSLSRSSHAAKALELFESIDWCTRAMADEIDPDGTNNQDRDWLIAFAGEIVSLAFHAGAHARAADGKQIESYALPGKKVVEAGREGQRLRDLKRKSEFEAISRRIDELIVRGQSQSGAGRIAFKEGLGTSAKANVKLWGRRRPKK